MALNKDFKEFIGLLNAHEVQYLVVGGYAVALYGHPRYTKDIDIWVSSDRQNAQNLIAALTEFGFSFPNLNADDFTTPDAIIQLGYPPNRIDLLTTLSGVAFDECYASRLEVVIDDIKVCYIDIEHLIINKLSSGRYQDLADLENL
ncbi:MAG: nucleotidyltransferase [Tannerella sp.]|jgi:predicted nucleotidyltransferase|nr:nucleotidyltransferase [Tannerella sp.]